jgi:ribose transport system ATP-binding protein
MPGGETGIREEESVHEPGRVSHRHDDSATLKEANRVPAGTPILELKGLQKNYGYVQALKPATMTFLAGEIHAIVGENGAGKSTLIKLLTGVITRTAGEVCGAAIRCAGHAERGDRARHQCRAPGSRALPHLTVAANLFLGDEVNKFGLMRKKQMVKRRRPCSTISASACRPPRC